MKDIDFDELDKAVNSVLSQEQQAAAPVVADTAAVATAEADTDPVDAIAVDTAVASVVLPEETVATESAVAEAPVASPQPEASPSLATKRRGKFMDVVHPSSDMNPAAPAATPSAPAVVAPISADMQSPSTDDASAPESVGAESTTQEQPAEAETLETPFSPEVDLSSLQLNETSEVTSVAAEATPVVDTAAAGTAAESDMPAAEEAGVETPFLSDAKIEKRPLGAFGEQGADTSESAETPAADAAPQSESSAVVGTPAVSEPMPRELQSDIVEVEKVQDDTVEATEVAPAAETPQTPEATEAPAVTTVSSDTGVPTPSGEVSHDEDAHPVFDASTYQQPLTPAKTPGKSKPAWLWWLVGIFACLAIGGGVGYAMFIVGF